MVFGRERQLVQGLELRAPHSKHGIRRCTPPQSCGCCHPNEKRVSRSLPATRIANTWFLCNKDLGFTVKHASSFLGRVRRSRHEDYSGAFAGKVWATTRGIEKHYLVSTMCPIESRVTPTKHIACTGLRGIISPPQWYGRRSPCWRTRRRCGGPPSRLGSHSRRSHTGKCGRSSPRSRKIPRRSKRMKKYHACV